ncbi:ubiquinone/menaquinone biosynthesis methylase [Pilimelia anulata]|uniref:Ubiquinone/menaquinone biosynthesis methylase n=1 Tax=Pilimelia anulata TaxID=53371 RepID=A0A8J3F834_9ACTN|nr:class I SAM-dependent methyltransferase [Pilimelia anulata]GGJ84753.1 ubiquinone/menaquinone biosynthesis methylase [Pilimelia anulata]
MDGTSGDTDYAARGAGYARMRRPDPRIAAVLHAALGDARTVLNVGAGAGSYEPADRYVVPVEPSPTMRAQRPAHLAPAVDAVAAELPYDDGSFDAAMALVTAHQWPDPVAGLRELRRVARGPVLVLTFDPAALDRFWLAAYAPELIAAERRRYPPLDVVGAAIGARCAVTDIRIPLDCTDGVTEAYYGRPERLLEEPVRRAQSAWAHIAEPGAEAAAVARLRAALADGSWDARYGHLRRQPEYVGSWRLLVGTPA